MSIYHLHSSLLVEGTGFTCRYHRGCYLNPIVLFYRILQVVVIFSQVIFRLYVGYVNVSHHNHMKTRVQYAVSDLQPH